MKKQRLPGKILAVVLSLLMVLPTLSVSFEPLGDYFTLRADAAEESESAFFARMNTTLPGLTDLLSDTGDNYAAAKAKLLTYYQQKFADLSYITYDTQSTSAQNTARNNILMYNESYIAQKTISAADDTKKYEFNLSASQTRDSYMLFAYQHSENAVLMDSSESSDSAHKPQLQITYQNGTVTTYTASEDTYIRAGASKSTNYADSTALITGHQASGDMPLSDNEARIYLKFSGMNTSNVKSAKLIVYARTVKWSDLSTKGSSALNLMLIKHCLGTWSAGTLTWESVSNQKKFGTYSWDGVEGGIVWNETTYGTKYQEKLGVSDEFLNYNSRFIQISSLCQTGHYTDAKNMLLRFAEQTYDVIASGTGFPKKRPLEAANRALEFPYIYKCLLDNNVLTAQENFEILRWYYQDIEYIAKEKTGIIYQTNTADTIGTNATSYFTNWGIWHLNGLYNCVNLFGEFNEAATWKAYFNARLSKVSSGLVYADGSYKEVTFGYAINVLEWLKTTFTVINQDGAYQPDATDLSNLKGALVSIVHYLLMCAYPSGILPDYGDQSANKEVTYATELLLAIPNLSVGLSSENKEKLENILWYYSGGTTGTKPQTSVVYDNSRLAVDRSDWVANTSDAQSSMLFFNAKSGGGHAHRDAMSFTFYAKGRELLTDRGTLTYEESAEENALRTKTYVANTVSVKYNGSTVSQKNLNTQATANNGLEGSSNDIAATYRAVTDTYQTVNENVDITHKRNVTYLKEYDLLLVNDSMEPSDSSITYTYSQNWHPLNGANGITAGAGVASADSGLNIGSGTSLNDNMRGRTRFEDGSNLYIVQGNISNSSVTKEHKANSKTYDSKNSSGMTDYFEFRYTGSGEVSFNTALLAYDAASTNSKVRLIRAQINDGSGNGISDSQASVMRAQLVTSDNKFTDEIVYYNSFESDEIAIEQGRQRIQTGGSSSNPENIKKINVYAHNAYYRLKNLSYVDQLYLSDGKELTVELNDRTVIAKIKTDAVVSDVTATWNKANRTISIETSDEGIISGNTRLTVSFYPNESGTVAGVFLNGNELKKDRNYILDGKEVIIAAVQSEENGSVYFNVPEAIYLVPGGTDFQYALDQSLTVVNGDATLTANKGYKTVSSATPANVQFYGKNADSVSITCTAVSGTATLQLSDGATVNGVITKKLTGGSMSANASTYLKWTATYTDTFDGKQKTVVAYTYIYSPNLEAAAAVAAATSYTNDRLYTTPAATWSVIYGAHSFSSALPTVTLSGIAVNGDATYSMNDGRGTFRYNLSEYLSHTYTTYRNHPTTTDMADYTGGVNPVKDKNSYNKYDQNLYLVKDEAGSGTGYYYKAFDTKDNEYVYAPGGEGIINMDTSRVFKLGDIPNFTFRGYFGTYLDKNPSTGASLSSADNVVNNAFYAGFTMQNASGATVESTPNFFSVEEGDMDEIKLMATEDVSESANLYQVADGYRFILVTTRKWQCRTEMGSWFNTVGGSVVCAAASVVKFVGTNKTPLREAVLRHQTYLLGCTTQSYTEESINDYKEAYENAYMGLTRVDADPDCPALINALNAAHDALVKIPGADSTLTVRDVSSTGALLRQAQRAYTKNQSITTMAGEHTGYTYSGVAVDGETVTYTFAPVSYTLKINGNGSGIAEITQSVAYDAEIVLPSEAGSKAGYDFLGFSSDPAATTPTYLPGETVSRLTSLAGDTVTLYAVWVPGTYTVTLDKGTGTVGGSGKVSAVYQKYLSNIVIPEKQDNTFLGYFDAPTAGTMYINEKGKGVRIWDKTSDTVLYAHWEPKDIEISFDNDFIFNDFADSLSGVKRNGKEGYVYADKKTGELTVRATTNGEIFNDYAESNVGSFANYYSVSPSVTDGNYKHDFVLSFDVYTSSDSGADTVGCQAYVWWYKASGERISSKSSYFSAKTGIKEHHEITFNANNTEAVLAQLRLGIQSNNQNTTAVFSNIRLLYKGDYDVTNAWPSRMLVKAGQTGVELPAASLKKNAFTGWVDANGVAFDSSSVVPGQNFSLYSQYDNSGNGKTMTFDNLFSLEDYQKISDKKLMGNPATSYWSVEDGYITIPNNNTDMSNVKEVYTQYSALNSGAYVLSVTNNHSYIITFDAYFSSYSSGCTLSPTLDVGGWFWRDSTQLQQTNNAVADISTDANHPTAVSVLITVSPQYKKNETSGTTYNPNKISLYFDNYCSGSVLKIKNVRIVDRTNGTAISDYKTASFFEDVTYQARSVKVAKNSLFPELLEPSKPGYVFAGWSVRSNEAASSTVVKAGSTVPNDNNNMLYSTWLIQSNTVTYNANAGSDFIVGMPENQGKAAGVSLTLSDRTPVRTGYEFMGWATSSGATVAQYQPGDTYTADADLNLFAVWRAYSYTVSFDANGGIGTMANQEIAIGARPNLLANTYQRVGYHFDGWNTVEDGTGIAYADTAALTDDLSTEKDANVVLYAQWAPNSYTVVYNKVAATATGTESITVYYDDIFYLSNGKAFSNTGYYLTGWEIGGVTYHVGHQVINLSAENGATLTANALWNGEKYFIDYDLGALTGKVQNDNPFTHSYGVDTVIADLSAEGYTFLGWSVNDGSDMQKNLTLGGSDFTEDIVLHAHWELNSHSITYNTLGGSEIAQQTYYYGDTVTAPANPIKAGYRFAGWNNAVPLIMPDENVILNAVWVANVNTPYTVYFHVQDMTSVGSDTPVYDVITKTLYGKTDSTVTLADISQMMDEDKGIVLEPSKTKLDGVAAPTATQTTILANGSRTIDFYYTRTSLIVYRQKTNGVQTVILDYQPVSYGDTVTVSAAESWPGYTFTKWVVINTLTEEEIDLYVDDSTGHLIPMPQSGGTFTMPACDVRLVAVYTKDASQWTTVTFVPGAKGSISGTLSYEIIKGTAYDTAWGDAITKAPSTGYEFGGWSGIPTGNITEETVLTAVWNAKTYTVTLDKNAVSGITQNGTNTIYQKYENGYYLDSGCTANEMTEENNPITLPARTGHTFLGYFTEKTGGVKYIGANGKLTAQADASFFTGTDNKLYAHWTPGTYTVTLYKQGGDTQGTAAIYQKYINGYYLENTCETQITDSANPITLPTKAGYYFGGYYTGANGTGTRLIDSKGYLTEAATPDYFTANGDLYAEWLETSANVTVYKDGVLWKNPGVAIHLYQGDTKVYELTCKENSAVYQQKNLADGEYKIYASLFDGTVTDTGLTVTVEGIGEASVNYYTLTVDATDEGISTVTGAQTGDIYRAGEVITVNAGVYTGYSFDKWLNGSQATANQSVTVTMNGALTLTAVSKANTYTVTYLAGEGKFGTNETQRTQSFAYKAAITDLAEKPVAAKTGYIFSSWEPALPAAMPYNNLTVTAVYAPEVYDITYVNTLGVYNPNPTSYTVNTATVTLKSLTKADCTFVGWYSDEACTAGHEVTEIPIGSHGKLTLYAKWKTNTYTVTFVDWDGSAVDTQTVLHGGNAVPPTTGYQRNYCTFYTWSGNYENVEKDETVKAVYQTQINGETVTVGDRQYIVVFANYDNTVLSKQLLNIGEMPVYDQTPVREKEGDIEYIFNGWGKTVTTAKTDVTYVAQYKSNKKRFIVTFTDGMGVEIDKEYENGDVLTVSDIPEDICINGYVYDMQKHYRVISWSGIGVAVTSELTVVPTLEKGVTHNMKTATVAASCTQEGRITDTCTVCGYKTFTVIPQSHVLTTREAKAATCTQKGWKEYSACTKCDYSTLAQNTVPALGHAFGEWITLSAASLEQSGLMYRTCTRVGCGFTEEQEIKYNVEAALSRTVTFIAIGNMSYSMKLYKKDITGQYKFTATTISNSSDVIWFIDRDLTFTVYNYASSGYDTLTVYINNQPAQPDANGNYTIPSGKGPVTVLASRTPIGEETTTDTRGGTGSCNHICHSDNWLLQLLWKIVCIFCKLFGIHQYCDCGVRHW